MNRRFTILFAILGAALVGLAARLAHLQLVAHDESAQKRDRQSHTYVEIRRARGHIESADGALLAISRRADSVFVDPKEFADADVDWLTTITGRRDLREELAEARAHDLRFLWVLRRAPDDVLEKIRLRKAPGVETLPEFRRLYTMGGAILGFCNIDDRGMEGVERRYDALLASPVERRPIVVDARRRPVWVESGDEPRGPASLRLTIRHDVQRALDAAVAACAAKYSPLSVSAVAIDPRTGAIRAISVYPTFDPNDPGGFPPESRRNRAITDPYEPGSALKPIVVTRALELGLVKPDDLWTCPGTQKVGPRTIHCHETHGSISTVDVVAKSCNVAAAQIGVKLGADALRRLALDVGFGARTGVDLPGESPGRVTSVRAWNDYTTTSMPIGYELAATPLQLACAFSAIINGGRRVTPHVLDAILDDDGRVTRRYESRPGLVVYRADATAVMREMMRQTVERGTGREARVKGLTVGGKTGTTQKLVNGRYTAASHIGTFVGFAPVEDPKLVVVFTVDNPQGAYYGGTVAAPYVGAVFEAVKALLAE